VEAPPFIIDDEEEEALLFPAWEAGSIAGPPLPFVEA
jgi:hypothetical protein